MSSNNSQQPTDSGTGSLQKRTSQPRSRSTNSGLTVPLPPSPATAAPGSTTFSDLVARVTATLVALLNGETTLTAEAAKDAAEGPLVLLEPHEAGLASEADKVGARIANLIDALSGLEWVADGVLVDWCYEMRTRIIYALRAEGWVLKFSGNKLRVAPPDNYCQRSRGAGRVRQRNLFR